MPKPECSPAFVIRASSFFRISEFVIRVFPPGSRGNRARPKINAMMVFLANPRGFCAGVEMAVEVVNKVLDLKGPPIYVFHEIVHNRHVVEDFQRRGVTFINEISEVPTGSV